MLPISPPSAYGLAVAMKPTLFWIIQVITGPVMVRSALLTIQPRHSHTQMRRRL
jgi:hypothetical protein